MLKRIGATAKTLVLALALVFAFAHAAFAATDGTWTWTVFSPTNTTITGYSGPSGEVTIPATLGGTQVTDIGANQSVFVATGVTRVVIPAGVLHIGQRAFMASSVSSVVLPDTLQSIGDSAFANTQLQQVTIPVSVTQIADGAFDLCQQMTAAHFLGNAPPNVEGYVFSNTAPGFTVYYVSGSTGFGPPPPGPWVPTGNPSQGSYPTAYWPTFTITPTSGAHGTISPAVPTAVLQASDVTFTITPDAGYRITEVLIDGVSKGATTAFTFIDVQADHTIAATFAANPPADPYSVTFGPSGGGTLVQWAGSVGATGYEVSVGGVVVGTTGAAASSLAVPGVLGPKAHVTVTALGAQGTRSAAVTGVYSKSVVPVKIGTVHFAGNSSRLDPASKRTLRHLAALVAAQGFTSLRVDGFTAKRDHGSRAFRKRLSVSRAHVVKKYLAFEFRRVHARVNMIATGYGGAQPVGSNASLSGRAQNRRAELLLQ